MVDTLEERNIKSVDQEILSGINWTIFSTNLKMKKN